MYLFGKIARTSDEFESLMDECIRIIEQNFLFVYTLFLEKMILLNTHNTFFGGL